MDKLKQVQKYQFWIMLGVALILPLVGWFIAGSGLAAEAKAREKTLTDLNGQLKAGPDDPNKDWEDAIKAVNAVQAIEVRKVWEKLYERQKPLMVWPKLIKNEPDKFSTTDLEVYRGARGGYVAERERVRKVLNPLDDTEENGLIRMSAEMPQPNVEWESLGQPPSPKQMIAAQEDLWLLESIFKQIAGLNATASSKHDTAVRELVELVLRGGSAAKAGGSKSSSSGQSGMMGGASKDMEKMTGTIGKKGSGADGGAGGGGGGIQDPGFDPNDELGPEVEAAAEKGEKKTASSSAGGSGGMMGGAADEMKKMTGAIGKSLGSGGSGSNMDRYREKKPEWNTRAFYMKVVIDHRKLPDLLVALSNADFPISVLRVHMSDFSDGDLITSDGGGGLAGGAAGMMMHGGGGGAGGKGMMKGSSMPAGAKSSNPGAGGKNATGGARGAVGGVGGVAGEGAESVGGKTRSILDDPMLANVAIDGLIYIFKKPPEEQKPAQQPTAAPAAPATEQAAVANGVAPAATDAPAAAAEEEAAENESSEEKEDMESTEESETEEKPNGS